MEIRMIFLKNCIIPAILRTLHVRIRLSYIGVRPKARGRAGLVKYQKLSSVRHSKLTYVFMKLLFLIGYVKWG